jgi:hypothetical protein
VVAWRLLTAVIGFGLMAGVLGVQGRSAKVAACLFALSLSFSVAQSRESDALSWAPIRQESRPWTYWWWLGSAVTKEEITRHMELFKQAGLGGVHIIPIYGAQGYEDRYIPYLSDRWLEMLAHTLEEGQRLGLGVDMTLGTGWNMGGPWVDEETAAKRMEMRVFRLKRGEKLDEPVVPNRPDAVLHALMAYGPNGQILDLTDKVDAKMKRLDWSPSEGEWTLYAVTQVLHGMKVKRAAPGGEGFVIDFFSRKAMHRFLEPFDRAFRKLSMLTALKPRAVYHDSFEVMGENWTDDLIEQFKKRRGYDLRHYLHALYGNAPAELVTRVRSDFRQTIDELLLEESVLPWVEWSHRHSFWVRYEAHGSPGNLLDLYAAADIPESETFGPDWLQLAGLEPLPGTLPQRSPSSPKTLFLLNKFASSAAHVTGKPFCANETATWLGEHFKVPLEHVKALVDILFLAGINHIFYHGIPFSPADAEFPGWLFYASTHFGPTNTFWRHFPALNEYIARCQAFLQSGQPDNDLLVYFPVFDLWASDKGTRGFLHFLTAHSSWLESNLPQFTRTAQQLWERGYGFDLISDRLLASEVNVVDGQLVTPGGKYKALLIAWCTLMPPETLDRIVRLLERGANVLVLGELPKDVPGFSELEQRRQRFESLKGKLLKNLTESGNDLRAATIEKGKLVIGEDLEALMETAGIRRERMTDFGLQFTRRREGEGSWIYFIVNLSGRRWDGWVPISVPAKSAVIFEPMSQQFGIAKVRDENKHTEVYLQLEPRQSVILRVFVDRQVSGQKWAYWKPAGKPLILGGTWQVEFVEGGPKLPKPATVTRLSSWTEWNHDDPELLKAFSGTARYRLTFDLPSVDADAWLLDLGTVCYSARVWLNGKLFGTLISSPFRLYVPKEALREKGNELIVEVANLMANRIAYMDRQKVPWQKFFFVNIRYQPFSAADWEPLPSGLLGPVSICPLSQIPD